MKADDVVITAEDLRVWYGTAGAPVRAVDGVTFELRAGEILGPGRGVRLRQVDPGTGPARACCPTERPATGGCSFRDRDMLQAQAARAARPARAASSA